MATVFDEDHEGGTNGALVTTTNADYTSILAEPTFTSADTIHGSLGMRCQAPTAPVGGQLDFTATTKRAFRAYFKLKDWPTGTEILPIMRVRVGGSTVVAELRVNTAGQIILRNSAGVQDTSTSVAAVDATWGADLLVDTSAMTMSCRLYMSPGTGTLTETLTGTPSAGSFSRFIVGALDVGYAGTVIVDSVNHDDTTFVGPFTTPAASAGLKKYAVRGGALVELTAYRVGSGTLI